MMIGRFVFLRAAVLAFFMPAAALAGDPVTAAPQPAPLKLEDFTRKAAMSQPRVSPDGTHIAWTEDNILVIYDIQGQTEKDARGGKFPLGAAEWINNDDLVVYPQPQTGPRRLSSRLRYSPLIVSKDGQGLRALMATPGGKVWSDNLTPVVRFVNTPAPELITYIRDCIYTVDVKTGKRTAGAQMMKGDYHYFDAKGVERVAVDLQDEKVSYGFIDLTFRYRDTAGKEQTLKLPRQDKDNIYYSDFDYAEYDNTIYWSQFDYKTGITSTFRFDVATGAQSLFRTGPDKDTGLVIDDKGKVVGIRTYSDRDHTDWTDPYYKQMMEAVQKPFPAATVEIVDMSDDGRQTIFLISGPERPDTYYTYDATTHRMAEIGTNYPELEGQTLAPMTYITYKARDGLEIPAYVTKRKDTPPNAPLIVFPHGGPASRDAYDFDYEAQYFAYKGYVVLQPQYRGSYGFGDSFERAGNRHLAQMTTDLEDGVRYLAGQHMIDPSRVCVVGWSWGGYLAQAALAFTPDTYVCGISGDGVSDLMESLNDDDDGFWGGHVGTYWREIIGRKGADSDMIHATSPIDHVDSIKVPLLLIHGKADPVVSIRQSDRMNAAMKKADKDVTYISVPDMEHGPHTAEERLPLLKDMDDFIAKAFAKGSPAAPAKNESAIR